MRLGIIFRNALKVAGTMFFPLLVLEAVEWAGFAVCFVVTIATTLQLAFGLSAEWFWPMMYTTIYITVWTIIAIARAAHYEWRQRNWMRQDTTGAWMFVSGFIVAVACLLATLMLQPVSYYVMGRTAEQSARLSNSTSPQLIFWGLLIGAFITVSGLLYNKREERLHRIPAPKVYNPDAYSTQQF